MNTIKLWLVANKRMGENRMMVYPFATSRMRFRGHDAGTLIQTKRFIRFEVQYLIMAEFTSVEIEYSTSSEKWKGIRNCFETNDIPTDKIDAMITRIEKQGDASIEKLFRFTIRNHEDMFDAIFNDNEFHPCPHCYRYECQNCPLDDDTNECCKEWSEVKTQLFRLKRNMTKEKRSPKTFKVS